MRRIQGLPLLLSLTLACRGPEERPSRVQPVAVLLIAFTDGDAEVGLDQLPSKEGWAWMDAGLWRPLPLRWTAEGRGRAEVSRTSPDWLVLRDPGGGVHRLVLRDRPDSVPMPEPHGMGASTRLSEEDRGALAVISLAWVLSFVRH